MRALIKIVGYIFVSLSILITLAFAAWCWLMRDGLGPDSVSSAGLVAWSRFWRDFYPVLFFAVPVSAFGIWCIRQARAASH